VDHPRTRYAAAAGGVSVAYQVLGHGPVDLVCVPSAVSHLELIWEEPSVARYYRRLASFSRLILFDKRGVGMSDRVEGMPTLEERMDDVRAVMDAVSSSRAALFGMSEGGAIAAMFAASYPERVSTVVLLGAAIRSFLSREIDLDDPAVIAYIDEHFGDGFSLEAGAPSVAGDNSVRSWAAKVERMGMTPTSFKALLRMNTSFDARSVLTAVSAPTLVIHRTGDQMVGVDHGREIAELITGAKYVELVGPDHLPYFDDPESTLGLIEEFVTGERHQAQPDRVLATVVFTDIVESTRHASRLGDRSWRETLDSYDSSVNQELDRFRGHLIKTTGDGTLATFDGPGRAVQWARSIRDVTRRLGLELRAGVHTGEVELRADDIAGLAVVIGQRVSAWAGPSDILVSSTVKDLVVGSGIEFDDRGEHELKGVPGTWRLFAVQN
jgi:class 3 adenylate cyclase